MHCFWWLELRNPSGDLSAEAIIVAVVRVIFPVASPVKCSGKLFCLVFEVSEGCDSIIESISPFIALSSFRLHTEGFMSQIFALEEVMSAEIDRSDNIFSMRITSYRRCWVCSMFTALIWTWSYFEDIEQVVSFGKCDKTLKQFIFDSLRKCRIFSTRRHQPDTYRRGDRGNDSAALGVFLCKLTFPK